MSEILESVLKPSMERFSSIAVGVIAAVLLALITMGENLWIGAYSYWAAVPLALIAGLRPGGFAEAVFESFVAAGLAALTFIAAVTTIYYRTDWTQDLSEPARHFFIHNSFYGLTNEYFLIAAGYLSLIFLSRYLAFKMVGRNKATQVGMP